MKWLIWKRKILKKDFLDVNKKMKKHYTKNGYHYTKE